MWVLCYLENFFILILIKKEHMSHNILIKPLIRATNSGISAYVSKNGEIIESQTYFEDKTLTRNITLYSGHTFYSKYGNLPLLIFLILYVSFISFKKLFNTNIK